LDFTYNADDQRNKTLYYENGVLNKTMSYVGSYEKEEVAGGAINEYDYIYGPEGLAAIAVKTGGVRTLYYAHVDHLGSLRVVTTAAKTIQSRYHYDAWGRRMLVAGTSITNRGFTGHEHLAEFGLINMNARLYDPVLGRFLSSDNYVQMPDYTQAFNRYSYALNNPLIYVDPDGEWFLIDDLIAAVIGGIVNVVVNAIQGNIHSWGQGFALFGVGVVGTWAGLYTGPLVSGLIISSGNSFVNQGFGDNSKWNWSDISGLKVTFDGIMGGLTGQVGASLGGTISPYISKLTSGLGGQAIQQAATQSLTGSATGFVMSSGLAWMGGASFKEGLRAGGKDALMGFGIGFSTGMATGYRDAFKAGEKPWSGKPRIDVTADDLGLSSTMN
jgi:RHS repeat-associated protein